MLERAARPGGALVVWHDVPSAYAVDLAMRGWASIDKETNRVEATEEGRAALAAAVEGVRA